MMESEGARCEQCAGGPACGAGGVCVRTPAGAECKPDICNFFCLNQGTCSVSPMGVVSCACPPSWSGARCQRPACVDAQCTRGAHNDLKGHDGPNGPKSHDGHKEHDEQKHKQEDNRSNRIIGGDDHDRQPHKPALIPCAQGECAHGGRCVDTEAGPVCACTGAWGGARCSIYVGYDHACDNRACPPPQQCAWDPDVSATEAGAVFCACLKGASCVAPLGAPTGLPGGAPLGAHTAPWGAVLGSLAALLVALLGLLYFINRRRHSAFVHSRLADNVEINNPMYLGDDDEAADARHPHHHHTNTHTNGGNHFANPVYESMYAPPQSHPTTEVRGNCCHFSDVSERKKDFM
ncbi:hypothetical protein K1T71_012789 [Dendrolimus kikuchii]|uniref:Uncharacterized protein n=1 Tax=Dendrolimus kikuchii TaxID=765133 RepID=A0ACC1CI33_9NEOP|nr:hypothetical protein K1T71_012789 [Dendrolimus kikuchii]